MNFNLKTQKIQKEKTLAISRLLEWVSANFFQPVIKLVSKERAGGHIKRKYGRAKTPYRRLFESDQLSEKEKEKLTAIYQSLNPAELKKIDKKLDNLYKIYQKKKGQENISLTNKLNPSLASFSRIAQEAVSVS